MKQIPSAVRTAILLLPLLLSAACGKEGAGDDPAPGRTGIANASWEEVEQIAASGAQKAYTFTSPALWSAESSAPGWCEVLTESGPKGNATLRIAVAPNTGSTARSATVRITAGNFFPASFKVIQGSPTALPSMPGRMRRSRATTSGTKPTGRRNATCRSPTPVHTTTSSTIR